MSATVTLGESQLAVEPGGSVTGDLRIRNTGMVVDQFTVEVLGDVAAWATAQPPSVSLLPEQEGSVRLTFSPPRSERLRAGSWPFAIRVSSSEDPGRPVVHEGIVEVAPFIETVAELLPRTSRGRFRATHSVAFDNRGNTPVRAQLAATDEGDLLRFQIRPDAIVAAPGTAEFVQLRARPRKLLWRGQPRTAPFQVAVTHDRSDHPILLPGTLLQEPVIARWLPRALAALLAAVVALALVWQLLLKPTVESTAQEAAQEELAQTQAQAAEASEQAAAAEEAASGAAEKAAAAEEAAKKAAGTPTATTVPPFGVSASTPDGTPFDRRLPLELEPGETDSAFYQVPARRVLALTDIVLQNPQGDAGTLRLDRGDGAILSFSLQNFRDWDYHFVSPILVRAGQRVTVDARCTTPGRPAGLCRPSVFLGGFIREQGAAPTTTTVQS
jgi:hypothetical protein